MVEKKNALFFDTSIGTAHSELKITEKEILYECKKKST